MADRHDPRSPWPARPPGAASTGKPARARSAKRRGTAEPQGRRAPGTQAAAGAAARASAARAVGAVMRGGTTLDEALRAETDDASRDAALIRALAFGACRWHHRLEWQASKLLDKPLAKREVELAALIRIGLLQLDAMRVPDHAAVSATVDAAALVGAARARGLVNAVLRRFLRERKQLDEAMAAVPSARFSHPEWLIDLVRSERPGDWEAALDANNEPAPMWLRVNLRRGTRAAYVERLSSAGMAVVEPSGEQWPDTAVLLERPVPAAELPGFAEGDVSVQDGGAQKAAERLDLAPGLRVLDACAAPGGKAAHALERCPQLAELVAVEADAARLATVRQQLERLGLSATLIHGDATAPDLWWDGQPFDRILLDAPCSALGVIRRHPDIKLLRTPGDIERAAQLQARLLEALWPLLKPGGRLLYVTCTIARPENEGRVDAFLANTPDAQLALDPAPMRIRPGEANMDGFYYACLVKRGQAVC